MSDRPVPIKPLHPSVIPLLDPEYVALHNAVLQYTPPVRNVPLKPNRRDEFDFIGNDPRCEPHKVGEEHDFDLIHAKIHTWTPDGVAPLEGWPIFIFFHGGGFTIGNRKVDSFLLTTACNRAKCVVASVGYRLAPENPYPAAIDDAVEALQWVIERGKEVLNVDTSRIAIGGMSSGGNIAAVLALKAAEMCPSIPLVLQLLIAPVLDHTLTTSSRFKDELEHAPGLQPEDIMWFSYNYLPNQEDCSKWDASPIFAPDELVRNVPKAWIGVMEMDVLRPEGVAYGLKLREAGVEVQTVVFKGAPHIMLMLSSMSSALDKLCLKPQTL